MPDQVRLLLERDGASIEQAHLRAHFLMHDSVFGRWFTATPGDKVLDSRGTSE